MKKIGTIVSGAVLMVLLLAACTSRNISPTPSGAIPNNVGNPQGATLGTRPPESTDSSTLDDSDDGVEMKKSLDDLDSQMKDYDDSAKGDLDQDK